MFEILIAVRYLLTRKKELFISVINFFALFGITLGVATLVVVMSVMNGYESELVGKILSANGHFNISSYNPKVNYSDTVNLLKKQKHIKFVAPVFEGQAIVEFNKSFNGVTIKGMREEDIAKKPLISHSLIKGDWSSLQVSNSTYFNNNIFIGISMANTLGLNLGDKIRVLLPEMQETIVGTIPRTKTFKVAGIFDVGVYGYNNSLVFVPFESAKILFSHSVHNFSHIEVVVDSLQNVEVVKKELLQILYEDHWSISDWQAANQNLVHALRVERNVMFLILSLIIIIAAFNIISSLMILVKDKQKSIAVLRTMGASKRSIMGIFVLCGFTIGLMGTFLGGVLGVSFALNIETIKRYLEKLLGSKLFDPVIYFLTDLPSQICTTQVFAIIAFSLLLSLIATIYPAWRISKISPAEVLRYE